MNRKGDSPIGTGLVQLSFGWLHCFIDWLNIFGAGSWCMKGLEMKAFLDIDAWNVPYLPKTRLNTHCQINQTTTE